MRITFWRRPNRMLGRFTVMHAEKDGGAVLRGEASWRNASGFALNSRRRSFFLMVELRRKSKVSRHRFFDFERR